MKITRTTTGVIIHNPSNEVKRAVLKHFSLRNPTRQFFIYSGNNKNKKPLFGTEHDVLYITSGVLNIDDYVLQSLSHGTFVNPKTPAEIELKMNREPRSKLQEDCITKLTNPKSKSHKITIELKPGTGKAEPYSRKIPSLTPNGYTLMGDLKVGDYIFDREGKPTKILHIFEQGEKDVYKITFNDGRTAYCCKEHLWDVRTSKMNGYKTVCLEDLMKDFKKISNSKLKNKNCDPYYYKYHIPICKAVKYPHQQVPIDPWVFGCLIGNGCCREHVLTISCGTDEIPNKIADIYGFNVKRNKSNHNYRFYYKNGKPVRTSDFFKDIPEMIDCYSRYKKIPSIYMINDEQTRIELIKGLLDTDGNISYGNGRYNVTYTSCSINLLKDIRYILYSLGYSTGSIMSDKRKDRYIDGFCGSLHFKLPNEDKPKFFSLSYKLNKAIKASSIKKKDFFSDLLIKNIEFSHREKCRCLTVDNPERLYLTEDFIVTHNTFIATYSISKLGLKPLIVVPTTLLKNQWIEEFKNLGIDDNEIAKNIYDAPSKKICISTISAIENSLKNDYTGLMSVIDKSSFGIKVIDEAHLHLKGILKFDALCNIKHNWYMSATLGRSDMQEDTILNNALSDADRFIGNSKYDEYQKKYVNILYQDIYYHPSDKLCMNTFRYGIKGLIRSTYYRMLMDYKNGEPFFNNIIHMIKLAKKTMSYEGKILVLVPLIDIIEKVIYLMKKDVFFKQYTFSGVNGSIPLPERSKAMESDIILSTSLSMGTGVDVSNLGAVVNFDQYSSPIINEQIFGRLRDRGKKTWYFDIVDHVKQARVFEKWGTDRRLLMHYYPGAIDKIEQLPDIKC